jgi:16S rRNA (guanine(1405)-N(7))-methyltransferase
MNETSTLDELVQAVQSGPRYREIFPDLVRRVSAQELAKGRSWKETVKAVRNKLHQVGGAYQEAGIHYEKALSELEQLPHDRRDPVVQAYCLGVLRQHASTRERLLVLEDFYEQTLASIAPVRSVMDLACGLNPLCLPWMPISEQAPYYACDIYLDQVEFINRFFTHTRQAGEAFLCDLTGTVPVRTSSWPCC